MVGRSLFRLQVQAGLCALALTSLGGGLIAQEPFPRGTEGELYYCPRIDLNPVSQGGPLTVTLDGVLDDPVWERADFQHWSVRAGENPTPDFVPPEEDIDLSWAAVADEHYLYLAWRVVDDARMVNESSSCNVWMDDSVEFYIDAANDGPDCTGSGASCYGIDDAQITVGADQIGKDNPDELEFGGVAGKGSCDFAGAAPDLCRGIVAELDSPDGFSGYQAEIAVALDTLGNNGDGTPEWHIQPLHGTTIGWNIHVNDDDNGGARDHKVLWSKKEVTETSWYNPGAFGKLQFITPNKALVTVTRDIPDSLHNGDAGTVSLTVTPKFGQGVVEIQEKLPPTLIASSPSNGGTLAGNTISWSLGKVTAEVVLTYTMTADKNASDVAIPGTATVDGEPISIQGDTQYRGSPITDQGFIKMWSHLGPLASGLTAGATCDPGADLTADWIVNQDETVDELTIVPFPGLFTKPKYGGTGVLPGGGARATGLILNGGAISTDAFPVWKAGISFTDTINHDSLQVNGFSADDHVTLSCVYVTNHTPSEIQTNMGLGNDDSIQVYLNDTEVHFNVCQPWGAANQEQETAPVTLPVGESRILVKVADGTGGSGFRLRFQKDPNDPTLGGLMPPDITLSLESTVRPPPGKVVRSLEKDTFKLGESVLVSLALAAPAAASFMVNEVLPPGAVASSISDGGAQVGETVLWNVSGITARTLTYRLTAASCQGDFRLGQSTYRVGSTEALVAGAASLRRLVSDEDLGAWTSRDFVSTGGASEKVGDRAVTVQGLGGGVRQTSDEFRFVYVPASGDFSIAARVECMDDPGSAGLGGLMVRETEDPFSANAYIGLSSASGTGGAGTLRATLRRETNKSRTTALVTLSSKDVPSIPVYLRIRRTTGKVLLERSPDGGAYETVASRDIGTSATQINLKNDVLIGFAVTGGGAGASRYTFADVSGTPPLPPFSSVPPPNAPVNLNAVAGAGKVDLTWNEPAPGGGAFTGYSVLRNGVNIADVPSTQRAYTDAGVPPEGELCYTVRATRGAVQSADSNRACRGVIIQGGFRRGDVDVSGTIDVTDAVKLLNYLFLGGTKPECLDAADFDNSDVADISDAVANLSYQFLGGPASAAPGPTNCGPDPTPDALGCDKQCQ